MKSLFDITLGDVKNVMIEKGYKIFNDGRPNIIGVRNATFDIGDEYNDRAWVWWNDGKENVHTYTITTHPGYHYLQRPIKGTNGTAILVPDQYIDCWTLDYHLGKQYALCQRGGEVKVYRDNNRDTILNCDPATIDKGYFGIDLHHGTIYDTNVIGPYSAGCQVWRYHQPHFDLMIQFRHLSEKYKFKWFSYTLLLQQDFEQNVIEQKMRA